MHRMNVLKTFFVVALMASLFAWGGSSGAQAQANNGAVYVLSNQVAGNAVMVYDRSNDGTLAYEGTYSTEGLGTGAGLGSQGALALNHNEKWLFAVNAGSNEVSVFSLDPDGLTFVDKVA